MFANNCFNVLDKFTSVINSEDNQELYQLEDEFNSVVNCEELIKIDKINEKSLKTNE